MFFDDQKRKFRYFSVEGHISNHWRLIVTGRLIQFHQEGP